MNIAERDVARHANLIERFSGVLPGPTLRSRRNRNVRPLASLAPYLLRYRALAAAALAALLLSSLATLAAPLAFRRMIDFGLSPTAGGLNDRYFAAVIALVAVLAGASALRTFLLALLGERIVADLRCEVFRHLTDLSRTFFDRAQTGELLSRLTADTTQIKIVVGTSLSIALRNALLLVGAAVMMVVTSPRLAVYVLVGLPAIILPLISFGRAVRRRSRLAQDTLANASAFAAEQISEVRTLQAFTNEDAAAGEFAAAVEHAFRAARHSMAARSVFTAMAVFLLLASIVIVLWVGAADVVEQRMTPGELSQFLLYAAFAAAGLVELSQVWGEIAQAAGAVERLLEIKATETSIRAPAKPVALAVPARGELEFKNVYFAYPTRVTTSALRGVSFHVQPGEKVAIVGPSGAGKSTIFQLVLRFYDPTSGSVTFDGVQLADLRPPELRRQLALVPQEPAIFATSVRNNILFGRPGASDAEVERAAELAAAAEFIHLLPQGYATPVGERGIVLSGGQRQRIAIARAILRDAPLLLLDEATAFLDSESEAVVQDSLRRLMSERTTLVIAHRLATVLSCDRILVMDGGRIVQQGNHERLVAQGGLYAHLAKLQFRGVAARRGAAVDPDNRNA